MHVIQLPNVQRSKLMNKIPVSVGWHHFGWVIFQEALRTGSGGREIITFYVNDTN